MFTKISVLVPTRHRIDRLRTMIDSYHATEDNEETSELVFRVDDDDYETISYLCGGNLVVGPRLHGYDSMPQFFNEMLEMASGDVLMCGNDDMIFRTIGWSKLILQAANAYPDGIFNFGVTTHNETHYPFSIISRKATECLGFLWDPRIFWGDIFLRDTMAALGRTFMLPDVQIDHDWAGNRPDQVFNEADKDIVRRNPTYWQDVHTVAVNYAVNKLRELM